MDMIPLHSNFTFNFSNFISKF